MKALAVAAHPIKDHGMATDLWGLNPGNGRHAKTPGLRILGVAGFGLGRNMTYVLFFVQAFLDPLGCGP